MPAAANDGVYVPIRDSIATIVFDQDRKHNALSLKNLARTACSDRCSREQRGGWVDGVTKRARQFGAGNDLVEFGALGGDSAAAMVFARAVANAMRAIGGVQAGHHGNRRLLLPWVGCVDIGGGCAQRC